MDRKKTSEASKNSASPTELPDQAGVTQSNEPRKNGGWREIEAMREKAALKESLADVWDEEFDLDDEILADLDHTAEFFTPQKDIEDENFNENDGADDFFEDDPV